MFAFASLLNSLSYVCSFTSFASFHFPILLFISNYNQPDKIPVTLFNLTLINFLFWLSYSLFTNLPLLQLTNLIGIIIVSIMLSVYWIQYAQKRLIPSLIYNLILMSSIGEIYYIVNSIIGSFGVSALGFSSIIVSIIKDISFLVYVNKAIKRRDEGKLMFYSIMVKCLNCLMTISYFSLMMNSTIVASYLIELFFCVVLLIKLSYYISSHVVKPKDSNCSMNSEKPFSRSELIIIQEKEQVSMNE